MGRNLHVVSRDGEWAVRRDGNERASSVHPTQQEATEAARKIAKKEKTEVVIHRADGRIRDRDSYGSDPLPPRIPRKVLFPKSHGERDGEVNQVDEHLRKQRAEGVRQLINELKLKRDRDLLFRYYIAEEDKDKICGDLGLTRAQFNNVIFRATARFKELYVRRIGEPEQVSKIDKP